MPAEKTDKRYQISSQLDTIFQTVDISIFVESESEHPGRKAGLKLEHGKRTYQS